MTTRTIPANYDFFQLGIELGEATARFLKEGATTVVYVVGGPSTCHTWLTYGRKELVLGYDCLASYYYLLHGGKANYVTATPSAPAPYDTIVQDVIDKVQRAPVDREVVVLGLCKTIKPNQVLGAFSCTGATNSIYSTPSTEEEEDKMTDEGAPPPRSEN